MGRLLAVAILSSVAFAQSASSAGSKPAQDQSVQAASRPESAFGSPTALPPRPRGKSTVIGGAIRGVDTVRDQFTLNVFGGRTLKVLFDERTQVYRDGARSALRDLQPGDHVSVETVLDGTTPFARRHPLFLGGPAAGLWARSFHLLSAGREGECQGQVLNYNPCDNK